VHKLDSFGYRVFVTTGFYVSLFFVPLFQRFVFNTIFVGFVVTELVFLMPLSPPMCSGTLRIAAQSSTRINQRQNNSKLFGTT
jgi:hypothetical protein